jgi:hypothetical protein
VGSSFGEELPVGRTVASGEWRQMRDTGHGLRGRAREIGGSRFKIQEMRSSVPL